MYIMSINAHNAHIITAAIKIITGISIGVNIAIDETIIVIVINTNEITYIVFIWLNSFLDINSPPNNIPIVVLQCKSYFRIPD